MNKAGLKLVSRFSMSPNQLGYCGHDTAGKKFVDCITKDICEGVGEEVKHFIVLNPYLKTISKSLARPMFSKEVVESYWLGNESLKKIKSEDYDLLLDNFVEQGVPDWLVQELRTKRPKAFIPTHLFQVLHVGVGRASGSVPYNLDTINNCMIRWGKVVNIMPDEVSVEVVSLATTEPPHTLKTETKTFKYSPLLMAGIKKGATVAIHWGWAVKILTPKEKDLLSYWTTEVLNSF